MMMHLEPEEEEKNTDLQALSKPATEQQRM
jgi:hypothetical protein